MKTKTYLDGFKNHPNNLNLLTQDIIRETCEAILKDIQDIVAKGNPFHDDIDEIVKIIKKGIGK